MTSERHGRLRGLIARIGDDLPGAEFEFRPMFGAYGVYSRGRFFAVIGSEGLALKLAPADREALLALPGAHRWSISGQYVVVPDALTDPVTLRPWVERSVAYAQTLPLPARRTRRR